MIIGLGVDLVELSRIRRIYAHFGSVFAKKILHAAELAGLPQAEAAAVAYLAARFAAKEAAVKALGCGFRDGIWFQDFRVVKNALGRPDLEFHGLAEKKFAELNAVSAHLSLTHGRDSAAAVVILEK